MKIPSTENIAFTKHERIIGSRIDFDFDHPLSVRVSVSGGSVHLRDTPDRIRILHLWTVKMRRQDFRSNQHLPHNWTSSTLARVRARFMDPRSKPSQASASPL